MSANRIEVYEADRKGWRWRIILNSRPVAVSVESYRRKRDAERGAWRAIVQIESGVALDVKVRA